MSNDNKQEEWEVILNMQEFNPKKAELLWIVEKYKHLESKEIVTQEDYDEIHTAQVALQKNRTFIKNQWLAIREKANKWIDEVLKVEKELLGVFVPLEDVLKAKKDEYNARQKKKEEEEKARKEEILNSRIQELWKYGYVHDMFDLRTMEDHAYEILRDQKKAAWEQAELDRKNQEARENRRNERHSKAMAIGMYFDASRAVFCSYLVTDIFITSEEISALEDEEFQALIDSHSAKIVAKQDEQKKAQEALDKQKQDQLAEQKRLDDIAAEQKKADDEKKRQADLEEAKKQAAIDTQKRLEKEAADKKAKEEADKAAEQKKLAKEKRFKEFKASIWYTEENKSEFTIKETEEWYVFYKKVGVYLKTTNE